jgi:hypothetical protein
MPDTLQLLLLKLGLTVEGPAGSSTAPADCCCCHCSPRHCYPCWLCLLCQLLLLLLVVVLKLGHYHLPLFLLPRSAVY